MSVRLLYNMQVFSQRRRNLHLDATGAHEHAKQEKIGPNEKEAKLLVIRRCFEKDST